MKKIGFILLISLIFTMKVPAQQAEREALSALGLEDIRVVMSGDTCYIAYEDNVYRTPYRGVAAVVQTLRALPEAVDTYCIVMTKHQIPQINVILPREVSGLQISNETDPVMQKIKGVSPLKRSAGKIDLVIYPTIYLENSWLDKLYGTAIGIAPAVEIGLWKGAYFIGQVVVPFWTNMTDEKKYIRPGVIALAQEIRFTHNIQGMLAAGNFTCDRAGIDAGLSYRTNGGRWETGITASYTGSSTFYGGEWKVCRMRRFTGALWGRYNEPKSGLQIDVQALRLVYGDMGARVDLRRHFKEVTVGFYAMNTGRVTNGGFYFSVPISPRKQKHNRLVNIRLPEYYHHNYQAVHAASTGNLFGYTYQSTPKGERNVHNYNPDYIKTNVLNLLLTDKN